MKLILALLLLSLPAVSDAAIPLKATPDKGAVTFLAVGRPSMLKIHGKATGAEGKFTAEASQLKGSAEFEIAKLDTGINLRNEHMKDKYLLVKEHPKAKLTLTDAPLDATFATTLSNAGEKPFKGKLELKGKEQEVDGTFTAKDGLVKANFEIKLTKFGIELPSYLGITVAENVAVAVELPLQKE